MKIGTQNQHFFPENLEDKFNYLKDLGIDGFEIDGSYLVENLDEVGSAIEKTGVSVTTACGGYSGWIGDFNEEKRKNGLNEIINILSALKSVGGKGIVVPAAWGMFTYRLPPMQSPRNKEDDWNTVSESLLYLDEAARETDTQILLEPLNRYQDYMINTLAEAKEYIEKNKLSKVKIIADFYHMNIEEDNIPLALHTNRDLIEHIHLADNHRYQPGSGSIDFKSCFKQLQNDQYDGYLTLECRIRGQDPDQEYRKSIRYLNALLDL